MWLINTTTLLLEEVRNPEHGYAILSHRWRNEEVSFQDMKNDERFHKQGWAKISGVCDLARRKDLQYVWVDTCCINKDSETELSEAIRSMYRWYSESKICFAYLEDVGGFRQRFERSEWFERGWTLQELIAPSDVSFYDHQWLPIGDKRGRLQELHRITGIPHVVLQDRSKVKACSVAQRMSWAANRKTERVEDRAYSLLGLFGVHMPLLYGSGEDAFLELQKKIVETHPDHSIFAWIMDSDTRYAGAFAPSPSAFASCAEVKSASCSEDFRVGSLGVPLNLPTTPYNMNTYLSVLRASRSDYWCAILLMKLPGNNQYVRVKNQQGASRFAVKICNNHRMRVMRITVDVPESVQHTTYGFWLRKIRPPGIDSATVKTLSAAGGIVKDRIAIPEGQSGTAGIISITPRDGSSRRGWSKIRWIKLGFDDDFQPVCLLASRDGLHGARKGLLPQNFKQAALSLPGSKAYEVMFDQTWIADSGGRVPTIEDAWPSRYYVHRVTEQGALLRLTALNLEVSIRLLPDRNPGSLARQLPNSPHKVWVVDIADIDGPSPEWQHCHNQCLYIYSWTLGAACALCGFPCILYEVMNR